MCERLINMKPRCALLAALVAFNARELAAQATTYRGAGFEVSSTSVRQAGGRFVATAAGRDTIYSTYPRAAREVHFKFALNGIDNEFPPGIEHTINLRPQGGRLVTPLYAFAVPPTPSLPRPEDAREGGDGTAQVTIRLDMRAVKQRIASRGYYDPPLGARVTTLESVWVIGDTDPLIWDARSLRAGMPQELKDADGDGVYEVTLPFKTEYLRPRAADGRAMWARRLDLSAFPTLESKQPLFDALYRMSLEELQELRRPDGALSAGAKWPGVWTRDVSLSAVLALALIAPDAVRASLLMKVDSTGRIIQDTGTGGSWPISTDRMTWALAAWEVYAVTGDTVWLRKAYGIISRSAEADRHAAVDASTGLMRGESSFLDWREQSYPRWMQPADIYQSENLGTNAVHMGAYGVLAQMARALGEPSAAWDARADSIRRGLHEYLWQPALGYHAQYRYGRVAMTTSPRAELLGESLAMLYGAADGGRSAPPRVAFGVPTFWPFIAGEPFYHNATIWPFVTAYWTWASAERGDVDAVAHGLATTARAGALFLTNKENMVAETGHFEGTALNSDRQLWSVAGTLAMTYRVLFGMRVLSDRLVFRPVVPEVFGGERVLRGVRYRGATLTVTLRGTGTHVMRATLDGRVMSAAEVPATLMGAHDVLMELDGAAASGAAVSSGAGAAAGAAAGASAGAARLRGRMVAAAFAPATPAVSLRIAGRDTSLTWAAVPTAVRYVMYRDGRAVDTVKTPSKAVRSASALSEYQVLALDARGLASFLSEPVRVVAAGAEIVSRPPGAPLRLERTLNTSVMWDIAVPRDGRYALDARYANGNGPINTEDKAAVRTLLIDGREAGVLVMPQRGSGRWGEFGFSNAITLDLRAGRHAVEVRYAPLDRNMNGVESTAVLEGLRATRVP